MGWKIALVGALVVGSTPPALAAAQSIDGARAQTEGTPAARIVLDVPYVAQGLDLCGGAAAAMVMQYWGDTQVDSRDFTALVDSEVGGIRTSALVDDLRARGWQARPFRGSAEIVRSHLAHGRPLVVLVDDPDRAPHYVVVVSWVDDQVVLQDPSLGPYRPVPEAAFLDAWERADRWTLLILPGASPEVVAPTADDVPRPLSSAFAHDVAPPTASSPGPCETATARAVQLARDGDLEGAGRSIDEAIGRCPRTASLHRERAALFLLQERCGDAAASASMALRVDPDDALTWEILATARYVCGDAPRALDAWNRIDLPHLGAVTFHGLERTPAEVAHTVVGLERGALLTGESLTLARRRVEELPALGASRVAYRMEPSGGASVDVVVRERSTIPSVKTLLARWLVTGAFQQRLELPIANARGWGELITLGGRWRHEQRSASAEIAVPRLRGPADVWTAKIAWAERTVAADATGPEEFSRWLAGLEARGWAAANLRWHAGAAFESWQQEDRFASARLGLERRLWNDHVMIHGEVEGWIPLDTGARFGGGSAGVKWVSTTSPSETLRFAGAVGVDGVGRNAPAALWPAADLGRDTDVPIRAHSVADDGVLVGPALGPRLWHATVETRRWIRQMRGVRLGAAVFADVARPLGRPDGVDSTLVDAGLGFRLGLPGGTGTLRVDIAKGLSDGATGVSIGWQDGWGPP